MAIPDAARRRYGPPAALALIVLAAVWFATHDWQRERPHLQRTLPYAVMCDEPHLLVILHSVLFDRDLAVGNNYRDVAAGGLAAGRRFRHGQLDPHVRLVDTNTGQHAMWIDIYDLRRRTPEPDAHGFGWEAKKPNPFPPGSYVQVPAHPPAFSAFLAACLAPFDPAPDNVEPWAGLLLLALSLAALPVTYAAARAAGVETREAVFAVLLLGLCSPWLAYSRSLFSATTLGLLLLLGLWAHLRGRPAAAALAVAAAMWIKPMFLLPGLVWLAQHAVRRRYRDALVFSCVLALAGAALMVFNYRFAGTPLVVGNGSTPFTVSAAKVFGEFFDTRSGLFVFAPWTALVLAAAARRRSSPMSNPTLASLLGPCLLYLLLLFGFSVSGGAAYGCRYWVPFLPFLAIVAATTVRRGSFAMNALLAVLALAGFLLAAPGALLYGRGENWREPFYTQTRALLVESCGN